MGLTRTARAPLVLALVFCVSVVAAAQEPPPVLTAPVNDFAGVIDAGSEAALDSLIRSLERASGDVVVVAAVDTFAPYGDIREYAVRMFENGGRGIGQKGRDNGLLILLAVKDRQVWVEVGYDLEEFITDGFAGEVSRNEMAPLFRRGEYGAGLYAGASRLIERIAERRNVTLDEAPRAAPVQRPGGNDGGGFGIVAMIMLFLLINAIAGRTQRRRRRRGPWGMGPWGGWHSGVGPFGGGFGGGFRGGGFGGGGFGGGFGGFGGGRSGGGGGGASW